MPVDDDLWRRLSEYSPDDPKAHISFSDRLRRESNWTLAYTKRVVEEYKRFIYLACVEEHEMTPSEDVDAAWHLHLVHTRSYWDELCGEILGRKLHHGPTTGGARERKRFGSAYEDTLASYLRIFGSSPPPDIWPTQAERFAKTGRMRWVDTGQSWVIRKPRLNCWPRVTAIGGAGVLTLSGAQAATEARQADSIGLVGLIGLACFLGWRAIRWMLMSPEERAAERAKNKGGDGGCSSGCSSSDSSGCSGGCSGGCGGSSD